MTALYVEFGLAGLVLLLKAAADPGAARFAGPGRHPTARPTRRAAPARLRPTGAS
jgi:hypothetical protein